MKETDSDLLMQAESSEVQQVGGKETEANKRRARRQLLENLTAVERELGNELIDAEEIHAE